MKETQELIRSRSKTMTTFLPTNVTKFTMISTNRARDKPPKPTRE